MSELLKMVGETTSDDLFVDLYPLARVEGRIIRAQESTPLEIKRGTIMAISSADGKLVPLGTTANSSSSETLTPDCVLCDDITVATSDINVAVYASGCFNANRVITVNNHVITAAEKDTLRKYDIILKAASKI